jgi:hypothetical protein
MFKDSIKIKIEGVKDKQESRQLAVYFLNPSTIRLLFENGNFAKN